MQLCLFSKPVEFDQFKYLIPFFNDMKLLFICNQGKHRSKTAAEIFSKKYETKYAGLFSETPVAEKDLNWADIIFVMEDFQRAEIAKRFPAVYLQKKILCLNVSDVYGYKQPELVKLLTEKVNGSF
jgi:predicted protein tyrosine phosphatase